MQVKTETVTCSGSSMTVISDSIHKMEMRTAMVVSADAILQADATLIVGVIFLATLRQAVGLPITSSFLQRLYWPIIFFCLSALGVAFEGGGFTIDGHDPLYLVGRNCFTLGLFLVFWAMYRFPADLRKKESEKAKT